MVFQRISHWVLWKFLNTVALMAIALLKVWMIFLKTKNPRFLRKKLLVKRKQCYWIDGRRQKGLYGFKQISPEQTVQACHITCYRKSHETCLNGLYNPSNNSSNNSRHKKPKWWTGECVQQWFISFYWMIMRLKQEEKHDLG